MNSRTSQCLKSFATKRIFKSEFPSILNHCSIYLFMCKGYCWPKSICKPHWSNMEEGNSTQKFASGPTMYNISSEDSNWIMTSAFIIFTMQTGIVDLSYSTHFLIITIFSFILFSLNLLIYLLASAQLTFKTCILSLRTFIRI